MSRIWRWLWTGDWHLCKWVRIKEATVANDTCGTRYTRYYCQCETCGEMKVFNP